MTIAAEIVAGWGSAALLSGILHGANEGGPAFLSWSECVLGLCVCRGCVVGSQKHRSADSCSSVGVRGFQAGRTDSQLWSSKIVVVPCWLPRDKAHNASPLREKAGLVGEGKEITRLVGEGHQEVLHWTYKFERQAYHCVRAGRHASTQARAHASKHAGKREPAQAIMQAWHQAIKHTSAHARRRSITRSRNHPRTQARTRLLYHHRRSLGVRSVYLQHEQCHP